LLLDGGYTERFTQRATEYGPFTLGFHPPGLTHEDEIGVCGSRMLCIELRESFWQKTRGYLSSPKFTPLLCGEETVWLCVHLYRAFRAGTVDSLQVEEACVQMVERCAQVRITQERTAPKWLERAEDLLHANFGTQVTLDGVAKELSLHPIHLSRVFRKKYGCTLGEYVNRLRVQQVCAEMSRGWPALDELALSAGFADQSHMGRVFRAYVGETPARFREFLHNARHTSA
jgi:AraC family transcriptional regulator